jgi:hypothetical protein
VSNTPAIAPGRVSMVFLETCASSFGAGVNPSAGDLSALHELFHSLGAVSPSCPNSSTNPMNEPDGVLPPGHVMDDSHDLMWYGGIANPNQVHIDAAHDDYWGSNNCLDVSNSALLTPTAPDAFFPSQG